MSPRDIWLYNRIQDFATLIGNADASDRETYMDLIKGMAKEILYCVTEWEKYYEKNQNK